MGHNKKICWIALITAFCLTFPAGFIYAEQESEQHTTVDSMQQLEERVQQFTDRFIIRNSGLNEEQLKAKIDTAFNLAQSDKQDLLQSVQQENGRSTFSEDAVQSLSPRIRRRFSQQAETLKVTPLSATEEYQTVQLTEQVDPEQFSSYLVATGIEPQQIQPDYQLILSAQPEKEKVGPDGQTLLPEEKPEDTSDDQKPDTAIPSEEPQSDAGIQPSQEPMEPDVEAVESVTVALIDTGVDVTHPALMGKTVPGYDFYRNSETVYLESLGIDQAHGTHLASVIAQQSPEVKIMPLKCFENGRAYTSNLIRAIAFAKEHGASIVNCSWGSGEENEFLKEAMQRSGLLFVCAAGNERKNLSQNPVYPAAFALENSICAASLNEDLGMSYFSNYGKYSVDIAAKGRDINGAFPGGGYEFMSGTSVSAAMVSAAAARYMARNSLQDVATVKAALGRSADKLSCLTEKVKEGSALNVEALLSGKDGETRTVQPADDFDVLGQKNSEQENWTLFAAEDNIQVSAGENIPLVLKANGTVWEVGARGPMQVPGLTDIISVASGLHENIAAARDGRVYTWDGDNSPQQVSGLTGIREVAAGFGQFLALKQDRTVWGWGYNDFGEAGGREVRESSDPIFEGFQDVYTPVQVWDDNLQPLSGIVKIAGGYHTSYALGEDGNLWQWGDLTLRGPSPSDCLAHLMDEQVQDFAIAEYKLIVLGKDQSVNLRRGIFDSADATNKMPQNISTMSGTAAVCADGSVWQWDWDVDNAAVTVKRKTGISGVVRISSGAGYAMAIKNDGTVWSWGDNSSPYYRPPNETSPSQIALPSDTSRVLVDEQYGVAGNAAYHLDQNGLMALGWSEYEDEGKYEPNCRTPEFGEFTAINGRLGIRKTAAANQPDGVGNTALVYAVQKTFTHRQEAWKGDPRVSVWTQNFKGDYAVEVKGAFVQDSSQAYYDMVGYEKTGRAVCVGRYRIDPGTNGDFSVYNYRQNGAETNKYPLWKNPTKTRAIKTVLHSSTSTFQTFENGSPIPTETSVEGAYPKDTFTMSDWGKRESGAYLSGIRISAQKSAIQNNLIAELDSVKLIEINAVHDIVDDAIAGLSISDLTDTPDRLKGDLKSLPTTRQGATITWTSSRPDIVSDDGKLVGAATGDTEIIMTAKITNPADKFTKYMDFKLKAVKTNGFSQQFSQTTTVMPSQGKLPGAGYSPALEHWTFWYPGTYSGTSGEPHDAQVLSHDGYMVFKKISDRQTASFQECLVGIRPLSDEEHHPAFHGKSELQFAAKTRGTGTFRFAPLTSAGKPLFELTLDASNKNIGIADGSGTVQKVPIDPTVERRYRFLIDTNGSFSLYVDGQAVKTAVGDTDRALLQMDEFDVNLSKMKLWITNITFKNTEVGFIKDIDYTKLEQYPDQSSKQILLNIGENEYVDVIMDMGQTVDGDRKYILQYNPAALKLIDLNKDTNEKEVLAGEFGDISVEEVSEGEIRFCLHSMEAVPIFEFQGKQAGNTEILVEKLEDR